MSLRELADAADQLGALSAEMWNDLGPHMTCSEADALVRVLTALGLGNHAVILEDAHAEGDEPGDKHHPGPRLTALLTEPTVFDNDNHQGA